MSIMEGGTMADFVRQEIFLAVNSEPKGTKKSIEKILIEKRIISDEEKMIYQLEADKMVAQRFLHYDSDKKIYVFSKDKEGRYSFQPATRFDKMMNDVLNFSLN